MAAERPNAPGLGPEPRPGGPLFWAGAVVGLGLVAYGVIGLLDHVPDPLNYLLYLLGGLIVHDALVVPTVAVLSVLLGWVVPVRLLPVVQGTLVVAAVLVLVAVPVVGGWGKLANNPSLLPLDYGRNLAIVLGIVLGLGALVAVRAVRRAGPRPDRPPSPVPDDGPRGW